MSDRPDPDALARALCPEAFEWLGTLWQRVEAKRIAGRILADPGPLLAALAEAGVLTEERRALDDGWVTSLTRDDVPEVRVKPATIQRRLVTKWRPTDA